MNILLEGKQADLMHAYLKSWQLTDGNGTEGDNLVLVLKSDKVDSLPPKGESYKVSLGDVYRDTFQISSRKATLSPREVRLVLSVAPFNIKDSTGYREAKSASWSNTTLHQVVSDCVLEHGYSVFIHPRLQKIKIEHVDRTDESTGPFLRRLANLYDAVAKPVDGVFVVAPKGEAKSATGNAIETITLSRVSDGDGASLIQVTMDLDGRNEFNGVKAFYVSTDDGQRHEVQVGSAPFKSLAKDCNSEAEAKQTATASLRKMQREGRGISISAPANPATFAEGIVVLDESFPKPFASTSSIDSVVFSGRGRQVKTMEIRATMNGEE
ncbi:hypothetical protein [Vibrio sp. TRT 17S01]|uniref:hypothetical protein n=1 Tax=Vibrio sp. TRT 17S01 TaxID=3418505 RepID=UPI003CF66F30